MKKLTLNKENLINKEFIFTEFKRYFFMVIGCICYSLSLKAFLIPSEIVGGGVSGAASLVNIKTGFPVGVFIAIINILILIPAFKTNGLKFIIRCFITTVVLSLITDAWDPILSLIEGFSGVTDNKILASLYGGVLQGIGIGLFIKYETSSGGTELLGRLTHIILPFGSIATHTALLDGMVVVMGAIFLASLENVLYALILIYASAKVSDLIIFGFSKAKLCYIITTKAEEISDYLISHSPRGVTLIQGEGMYSKTKRGVLLTCVKPTQVVALKGMIKQLDDGAFVIVCDANEVYGKGFHSI